jgi:hypothetical protein
LHHFGTGDFSYSTDCNHLTKDSIIRVVELRQHPLGGEMEVMVLLEIVDKKMENGTFNSFNSTFNNKIIDNMNRVISNSTSNHYNILLCI